MAQRHVFARMHTAAAKYLLVLFAALLSGYSAVGCSALSLGVREEPVTLRYLYIKDVASIEPLAKEFQRLHPNITITLEPLELDFNGVRNLESRADGADVIRLSVTMIPEKMANAFLPIDLQVSTAKDFPQSDIYPGALDGLKVDGKQVGLPAGINPFVFYYSPRRFAAAGVQPPPPNWTLDEFVTTAVTINNTGDALIGTDQYVYGFCSHPVFPDGAIFTYLFGGGLFDSLALVSRPKINQPANVDALNWYASLKTDLGIIPDRENPRGVGELMARSNCGFWIDWLDHANFGSLGPDDATPMPLPAYHDAFNVATLDGYFIFAKSEHPEEAWQWISFLMEQPTASGILVPPLQTQINSQAYTAQANPARVAVARSLPPQMVVLGMEMFRNERFGGVLELFSSAAVQVFRGDKDAQKALDEAQKQAEEIFK